MGCATGCLRHRLSFPRHGEPYRYLDFSPDGRLLALSDRHALYLVESASGGQFRERLLGQDWIDSLAFAPDNRTLAVGDAGSPADIHLWDLPTEKQIHILHGHRDRVCSLVFSPDGTSLLSGGADNTVLSWDLAAVMRRPPTGKALSAAKLTDLWTDLASKDAARAQRAVAELIQAPDSALPFLAKSLLPVRPAKMAAIAAWIADLDHDQFARRERASKAIQEIGEEAVPALRKVLKEKPTLEVRNAAPPSSKQSTNGPCHPNGCAPFALCRHWRVSPRPRRDRSSKDCRAARRARLTEEARASLRRVARRADAAR